MPGRIEFETKFSAAGKENRRRSQDSPMQILFMGNFSEQIDSVANELRIRKLDLDNFEQLMANMAPQLTLSMDNSRSGIVEIEFKSLEDFHPDRLFDRLPVFQHLKTLRADLGNPATFTQAAEQIANVAEPEPPAPSGAQSAVLQDSSLLDQLLGDRAAHIAAEPTAVKSQKRVDISAFIKNAIAPHIETSAHPQQDRYIESVDHAISELMRNILHHPHFQALEGAWRGVHECINRLESEESLSFHLLNVSKENLQEDFERCDGDIPASLLYRTVVEQGVQTLGGEPWSMLIGLYSFTNQNDDIALLGKLGQVAYHSGGPFIAAAHPALLGCESPVKQPDAGLWTIPSEKELKTWNELRDQPYAPWVALVFPRFLLRLPYGAKMEEIERFRFDEIPEDIAEEQQHSYYLWGNAAIACAVLIAQSYQQSGWSMRLGDVLEMDDLPLHVYQWQGEKVIKPCAEVVMSERSAELIESQGIMALMSYKDRNSVRLWRFRSLDRKHGGLAGPWAD